MKHWDVIIVGAGPAGCSAAITLACKGLNTLVLEKKVRQKLCGEFITPECFPTLERLGAFDAMLEAGAARITRFRLSPFRGGTVRAPLSAMTGATTGALSLSRGRFDQVLFDRAATSGANCVQGVAVKSPLLENGRVVGVIATDLNRGSEQIHRASLVIDASGRNSRLAVCADDPVAKSAGRLFAFKIHFRGVDSFDQQVELYTFPHGYGGLSEVEEGLANLCFIVDEGTVRKAGGDPATVLKRSMLRNSIAAERLATARSAGGWLSTGPLSFGPRCLERAGMFHIGDASGMIDPFSGDGIQMALRTGEIIGETINEVSAQQSLQDESAKRQVFYTYRSRYLMEFGNRFRFVALMRRLIFSETASTMLIPVLARFPWLMSTAMRAARHGHERAGA